MPELTFAHPERWWWLALLPVLLLLALPPRPRRVHWTAHLPQWRLALAGLKRRPPRALSARTVLLLLAAGCGGLAAMGLSFAGEPGPRRLVVALDASASMAAQDGDATAFARATATLRATFASLPPHVEVTLLRCGGPLLRRHGASARALQDLGGPGGAQVVDFAALARELAAADPVGETALWTLTDGQGQPALPASGALTVLGGAAPNAAVLAVRVVDRWPLPELELEADVVGHGPGRLPAEVSVSGAVVEASIRRTQLRSGAVETLRWSLVRRKEGGRLTVAVALAGDPLPDDDLWSAQLPPLPAPRIAVLADDEAGPFATVAARALAQEVAGEVVEAAAGVEVGLLLVDGGEVSVAPGRARVLTFGSRWPGAGEPDPWPRTGALDWSRTEPLAAGLDLSELRVDRAFGDTVPAGEPFLFAEPFGERRPLAVVAGDDELASVHFGFRLRDGNLPLLAAFPQLLRRAFVRCYGRAAGLVVTTSPPAAGEQDLSRRAAGEARPLPSFGTPDRGLEAAMMLAGLLLLAVRAWLR